VKYRPTYSLGRSDGDNGHGPPLRQSVIHTHSAAASAAASVLSKDFEAEHRSFSASIRNKVSLTVDGEEHDRNDHDAAFGTVQPASFFTHELGKAVADSTSQILKQGWLCKLARFGRNMKRYMCLRPQGTVLF
jgi:hypothetical protein